MSGLTIKLTLRERSMAVMQLLKVRLSALVVFSSAMTYLLASKAEINYPKLWLFLLGGFMVTGSANIVNQVIEKDLDALMNRTKSRPLPTGRLTVPEAVGISFVLGLIGLFLLFVFVNPLTCFVTAFSAFLYGFVYTPMKQKSPLAVAVGAIPGALPPLIGWVAVTGAITIEPLILFGIQFIWQFPHFWAIAWVLDDDYKKAGFKLLPSGGGRDLNTAFRIMIYTLLLIPLGLMPAEFKMTGWTSAVIATLCGTLFLVQTFNLMREPTQKAARNIMFGSFVYLPVVQIAYVLDKL